MKRDLHPSIEAGKGEALARLESWFGANGWHAFDFTGTAEVLPRKGDQVFVIAEDEVIEVS